MVAERGDGNGNMSYLNGLFSTVFERRFARAVSSDAEGREITALARDLLGTQGEVSGSTLARLILDQYTEADAEGKKPSLSSY